MTGREIEVPDPFARFVWGFLPDLEEKYDEWEDAIPNILRSNLPEDMQELRRFFIMLLEDGYSDKTLKAVWDACGPVWNFSLGGHRRFYRTALAELEKLMTERGVEFEQA